MSCFIAEEGSLSLFSAYIMLIDTRWDDQLGGDESPMAEAILDHIRYDAYKINIIPVNPKNNKSMREVYGLKSE